MEMQEITSFNLPDEIVQPFTISIGGDTVAVCAKEEMLVLQLRYKHYVYDGSINYVLSRVKCSNARPTGLLVAHEPTIYNISEMEERKTIMLDQTIFPNIAKVYVNNIQSWVSPVGLLQANPGAHLVANLTNMGQLTLYRQDPQWMPNWSAYIDVSAAWVKYIYDGKPLEDFDGLKTMVYEVLITCFCWQDKAQPQHPARFFTGTKSGKIVLWSLRDAVPEVEFVTQQLEAAFVLKHISKTEVDHILLVGGRSGRVRMYRFNPLCPRTSFKTVTTFFDEDLIVSVIECELDAKKQHILVLAVKGSFVLVVNAGMNGRVYGTGTLDLGHFMVTGLQQLEPCKYIASTMEGAIFLVHVERSRDGQLTLRRQHIKSDLNVSTYGLYGVATTRTRSCWLFLGYPTKRYDYTLLRSPTCVFFTKLKMRDPIEVLQNNRSFKMTDHYDAAEVVRYTGYKNIDLLTEIDTNDLKIELTDACSYQLKLKMISLGAKISYHCRRNKATTEILHNQFQFICTMIEVINAAHVLSFLAHVGQHTPAALNPLQQTAVLCLRNFITSIAEDSFPGDYEYVHLGLKEQLTELLRKTDTLPMAPYETCTFCNTPIDPDRCTCSDEHPVFRCVTTKVQIPLELDEVTCDMCQRYSLRMSMLALVFKDDLGGYQYPIDYTKCCLCDVPFKISQ